MADELASAVEITYSERGFQQYGEPVMTSYGHPVKVYESSAASGPHCWLSIEPSEKPGCEKIVGTAHLTVSQAVAIRDRLSAWIDEIVDREAATP